MTLAPSREATEYDDEEEYEPDPSEFCAICKEPAETGSRYRDAHMTIHFPTCYTAYIQEKP